MPANPLRVAVLVPCYNEHVTIAKVVRDFRSALPDASIYVYDNNSSDRTIEVALDAGAIVREETRQGKGNVVRRMFADVDADVYVLVDGDDTYDAASAPKLVDALLSRSLDMVVGRRVSDAPTEAWRRGHQFGNRLLTGVVVWLFGKGVEDMLSGYRVFSRRFVKTFPALATGFEIETELTVHALELAMPTTEILTPYGGRPEGSQSKLNSYRDGMRILLRIVRLFKDERPLMFFGAIAALLALLSFALGWPLVTHYVETGLVPRQPTAILATGVMLLAFLSGACGLILDTVTHGRREAKRVAYLAVPATHAPGAAGSGLARQGSAPSSAGALGQR
jgi:glycosyltransferase involved in cell wall biosynthesis